MDVRSVAQPTALREPAASRRLAEVAVLAAYLAAGILVTWPRAAYIRGLFPRDIDQAQYIWDLWWVAHQLAHAGNPWVTTYMAAPVGIPLGFDTLMPLPGAVMTPITLAFGPVVSYNLLAILIPGLACYAMYRVARLWLPGRTGAIAAGAFFGLSSMLAFQNWWHIGLSAGSVLMLLALETAVRLRRAPSAGKGMLVGLALGGAMLINQEAVLLAAILAALVLVPWLISSPARANLRACAVAAASALAAASPQLVAMVMYLPAHGAGSLAHWDAKLGANLTAGLFTPSPRLADFGLTGPASLYSYQRPTEGITTFGLVLSVLAVAGLAASWRRRSAWLLALLWLGSAALALGTSLRIGSHTYLPLGERWHGVPVSLVMPYTWFIRIPGLAGFREADRLALLGLVGAALLAGAAVEWLRRHAWPLVAAVAVLAALEAGYSGAGRPPPAPAALPGADRPIAADRSGSIVVDVPFGQSGGIGVYGTYFIPTRALVIATADGHPRAISYTSWVDARTVAGIRRHAFYRRLVAAQAGRGSTAAQLTAARRDLSSLRVGWLLVWQHPPHRALARYLAATGFRFAYRADHVWVYRPLVLPPR